MPNNPSSTVSPNDYAVIMAGGIGSRFWPMSRTGYPKQFHDLLGTGRTMLQTTYDRFAQLLPPENILVVTTQAYTDLVHKQLPELTPAQILAEPLMRNTAPCIAYATYKLMKQNPGARMVVAAADHMILDLSSFHSDLKLALDVVGKDAVIATLGISPTRPDTGYGYIQYIEDSPTATGKQPYYKVKTFTEKPNLELARVFLSSGDFVWNSGIFIFTASTMQAAIRQHIPDLHELFAGAEKALNTKQETAAIEAIYPKCKNISIDFGVMEKADNVYVIRSDFGWSDLGTWNSLYEQLPKDAGQNVLSGGNIVVHNAQDNMVKTHEGKLVVLKDIHNLIIVDLPDVLLIASRDDEQGIKEIVNDLRKDHLEKYL